MSHSVIGQLCFPKSIWSRFLDIAWWLHLEHITGTQYMVLEHVLLLSKIVIAVISILLFSLSLFLLIWIIIAKESICVLGSRYHSCV